jgi:hypothetical protein
MRCYVVVFIGALSLLAAAEEMRAQPIPASSCLDKGATPPPPCRAAIVGIALDAGRASPGSAPSSEWSVPVGINEAATEFFDPAYTAREHRKHLGVDILTFGAVRSPVQGRILANNTNRMDPTTSHLIIEESAIPPRFHILGHIRSDAAPGSPVYKGQEIGQVLPWPKRAREFTENTMAAGLVDIGITHWGVSRALPRASRAKPGKNDWTWESAPATATLEQASDLGWINLNALQLSAASAYNSRLTPSSLTLFRHVCLRRGQSRAGITLATDGTNSSWHGNDVTSDYLAVITPPDNYRSLVLTTLNGRTAAFFDATSHNSLYESRLGSTPLCQEPTVAASSWGVGNDRDIIVGPVTTDRGDTNLLVADLRDVHLGIGRPPNLRPAAAALWHADVRRTRILEVAPDRSGVTLETVFRYVCNAAQASGPSGTCTTHDGSIMRIGDQLERSARVTVDFSI